MARHAMVEGETKWELMDEDERTWAENTRFGDRCTGCDVLLQTEADFAKHFIIAVGFRNIGRCPERVSA